MAVRQNIVETSSVCLLKCTKRDGLLVDFEVTPDPRRIIRLPGTVGHMTVCKIISEDDLLDWENQKLRDVYGLLFCHLDYVWKK